VAALVARGLGNKEIAQRLGISRHTVRTHLHVMFRKIGVDSRTALALRFLSPRKSPNRELIEELLERAPGVLAVLGSRLLPIAASARFLEAAGVDAPFARRSGLRALFPFSLAAEERVLGCLVDGRPRRGVYLAPGLVTSCIPLLRSQHVLLVEESA
jgi:hypothetical protein